MLYFLPYLFRQYQCIDNNFTVPTLGREQLMIKINVYIRKTQKPKIIIDLSLFLFTVYENKKINIIIKKAEKGQGKVFD